MADFWSESIAKGVRLYQRTEGAPIYLSIARGGQKSRRSLGHGDYVLARQQATVGLMPAESRVAQPVQEAPSAKQLTLAELASRWALSAQCQARVGSAQAASRMRYLADILGPHRTVESLVPEDIEAYAHQRGKTRKKNTIAAELSILKAACRWAVKNRYAASHPFAAIRVERDPNAARPMLSNDEIDRLFKVAEPMQKRLLLLARDTGRRLHALRMLEWQDVDLDRGTITWRAASDKLRRTSTAPMSDRLWALLKKVPKAERVGYVVRALGKQPTDAIVTTTAERWLTEMMDRAKVKRPKQGGWHMFRRRWATDRKHVPLRAAMDAGGWRSVAVFVETYQRSDEDTLRDVVNNAPVRRQYDTGTVSKTGHTRTHFETTRTRHRGT